MKQYLEGNQSHNKVIDEFPLFAKMNFDFDFENWFISSIKAQLTMKQFHNKCRTHPI